MPRDLSSISKTTKRNRSRAKQIREQAPARATLSLNTTPASYKSAGVNFDYDYSEYTQVVEEIKHAKAPAKAKAPVIPAHRSGEIKEEKETFSYKAPDSYVAPEVVPIKEEKVEEEPVVEIKEEVVAEKASPMEVLAEKVASITPKKKEKKQLSEELLYEEKIMALEAKIERMSRQMSEMSSTLVYNLGAGSPGSGEVRINRMDDVYVEADNGLIDGTFLVWDEELQKWIGSSSTRTEIDNHSDLLVSIMQRLQQLEGVHNIGATYESGELVELENATPGADPGATLDYETETGHITGAVMPFRDEIADGDTTTFLVGTNNRGVYTVNGVAQPTIELPRGDTLVFDLNNLANPGEFAIFTNGIQLPLGAGYSRDATSVTINTGLIDPQFKKLYYRNTEHNGLGWIILITDN